MWDAKSFVKTCISVNFFAFFVSSPVIIIIVVVVVVIIIIIIIIIIIVIIIIIIFKLANFFDTHFLQFELIFARLRGL